MFMGPKNERRILIEFPSGVGYIRCMQVQDIKTLRTAKLISQSVFWAMAASAMVVTLVGFDPFPKPFRGFLLCQIVVVAVLAFYLRWALSLGAKRASASYPAWRKASNFITAGVSISIIGDLINSRLIDLTAFFSVQTVLSIPFFAAAHILYILTFYGLCKGYLRENPDAKSNALWAWVLLSVGLWYVILPRDLDPMLRYIGLGYTFMVVGMGVSSVWMAFAFGKRGIPATIGGVAFVISDGIIGHYLPGEAPIGVSIWIWSTYLIAQLLIVRTLLLAFPKVVPAPTPLPQAGPKKKRTLKK